MEDRAMNHTLMMTLRTVTLAGAIALGALRGDAAVCGDVNGDGALTSGDCQQLLDATAGLGAQAALCGGALACADLNTDTRVTAADAALCLGQATGLTANRTLCNLQPAGNVIDCPGGSVTVTQDLIRSQTWPKTCAIFLDGSVFVAGNVVLTIEPGTIIKGKRSSGNGSPSALILRRGAKLIADGTAAEPIVFTSDQPAGSRTKGDWGGLVLSGRAPVNVPGGEGLSEGLANVPFGGNDPNDSSGVLRYVRVEFAGRQLTIDNELNLLTLNSVGTGTVIDHVQAHVGLDDCVEWFGGTVNSKYVVATACGDDGFDWQLGTTGATQFGLIAQNIGIVEAGGNGFEGDNNENGFDFQPRSAPKFCNVTAIGTRGQTGTAAGNNQVGALLRRGTAGVIAKTIVTSFAKAGFELSNRTPACSSQTTLTGDLLIRNGTLFNNGSTGAAPCASTSAPNAPTPCDGCQLFAQLTASYGLTETDPTVPNAWPPADPRPTNPGAVSDAFDCTTVDPSFTATTYTGAFDPAGPNWLTTPWINLEIR
jgi:hypothetical protein